MAKKTVRCLRGNLHEKSVPYLFILPFIISFLVFFFAPAIYSLVLSFYKYKGYGKMNFLGFDNYISLLTYGTFWQSVGNTVFYYLAHMIPTLLIAFVLAMMLHSKYIQSIQGIFKPVLFMPQIVPIVATSLIFKIMFSTQYGAINQILGTQIEFLSDSFWARWSVVIMITWRSIGWYMVILLAGLTTISDDIIEASTIDGASLPQRVIRIIIPLMRPIFLYCLVMSAISSIKLFTEVNVLLADSSGFATRPNVIPVMNILKINLSGGNFGMASAAGWLIFVLVSFVSVFQFKILGKEK